MNTLTKALLALVAVVVIAGGAYVMLGGSNMSSTMVSKINSMTEGADTTTVPPATDSVDDFAKAMQADVSATASAINAFDVGVNASVESVKTVTDTNTLYDPNNI